MPLREIKGLPKLRWPIVNISDALAFIGSSAVWASPTIWPVSRSVYFLFSALHQPGWRGTEAASPIQFRTLSWLAKCVAMCIIPNNDTPKTDHAHQYRD